LPTDVTLQLKNFAKEKGLIEEAVLKSALLLRPIYNNNLPKEERLFVCRKVLLMCDAPHSTLPTTLVRNKMNEILKN
jgi:hypothetical protein